MDNREIFLSSYRGIQMRMPAKFGLIRLDISGAIDDYRKKSQSTLRYNKLVEKLINNERRKRIFIKALVKCVSSVLLMAVYLAAMVILCEFLLSLGAGQSIRLLGVPAGLGLLLLYMIMFDKIDDLFETNIFRIKVKRRNKIYSINNSL